MMHGIVICICYTDEWVFEIWLKATDGGGLAVTLCTGVLGKVEGEGLQTRNGTEEF